MSLAELDSALKGAKEKMEGMEAELGEFRNSIKEYVSEFGKRQRQYEKDFGMNSAAPRASGTRTPRGGMATAIQEALKSAKAPMSVDEIVTATGAGSKPSVSQTLMKLVQSGEVQRYNSEGKTIKKDDKTQRARGYALA